MPLRIAVLPAPTLALFVVVMLSEFIPLPNPAVHTDAAR